MSDSPLSSNSAFSEAIGTLAAILTTVAFAPQAIRTWRSGGDGLSWAMLALFGAGVGLWFIYGVLRGSGPLMLANGLTGAQVLFILAVKIWRAGKPGGAVSTANGSPRAPVNAARR